MDLFKKIGFKDIKDFARKSFILGAIGGTFMAGTIARKVDDREAARGTIYTPETPETQTITFKVNGQIEKVINEESTVINEIINEDPKAKPLKTSEQTKTTPECPQTPACPEAQTQISLTINNAIKAATQTKKEHSTSTESPSETEAQTKQRTEDKTKKQKHNNRHKRNKPNFRFIKITKINQYKKL